MTRLPAALAIALTAFAPHLAAAAEWHYCLAASHQEPIVYVTEPFSTTADTSTVEAKFTDALKDPRSSYDDVQCPRAADKASILDMEQYAANFNVKLGNKVIRMRWMPPR